MSLPPAWRNVFRWWAWRPPATCIASKNVDNLSKHTVTSKGTGYWWLHRHILTAQKVFITHAPCAYMDRSPTPMFKTQAQPEPWEYLLRPSMTSKQYKLRKICTRRPNPPQKCIQLRPILRNYFKVLITLRRNNSWQKLQLPKRRSVLQQQFYWHW